ncbi:hypothetical protein QOT17_014619 [Balamuthia mandrillaris]
MLKEFKIWKLQTEFLFHFIVTLKERVDQQEKSIQALQQKQNTNQPSRPSAVLQEKKQHIEQRLQRKAIQFIVNTPNSTKAEKDEVFEEVIEELLLEEKVVLRASLKQTFKNKLKNFRFGLVESVCTESRKLGETEALVEEREVRIKELPTIKKYKLLSSADADFWEDLARSQWRTTTPVSLSKAEFLGVFNSYGEALSCLPFSNIHLETWLNIMGKIYKTTGHPDHQCKPRQPAVLNASQVQTSPSQQPGSASLPSSSSSPSPAPSPAPPPSGTNQPSTNALDTTTKQEFMEAVHHACGSRKLFHHFFITPLQGEHEILFGRDIMQRISIEFKEDDSNISDKDKCVELPSPPDIAQKITDTKVLIEQALGLKWATLLDLVWSYNQILFVGTPFGVKHVQAVISRFIVAILCLLIDISSHYVDDILVFTKSSSLEQHISDIVKVINALTVAGLRLHLEKCQFGYT